MQQFEHFIAGAPVSPASAEYLESENPFTGEAWARIARGNRDDVHLAVDAARDAFQTGPWGRLTPTQRGALLRRLGDLVSAHGEELARAEVRDNGKTIVEMRNQLRNIPEWYYYYGGLADKNAGEVLHTERPNHFNFTRHEPIGVVALITPWNSPLRLLAWKLAPALAAGNTVVIKPSEFTSTSTLDFVRLFEEAGFPPGVVNVVTGLGSEVGTALVGHPDVGKVAFTGGTDAGRAVYETAARGIKPVLLELGGKSPNIVFSDADVERAAKGAVAAIFGSGGQSCVAGSRLLVQQDIHDAFVERIVALAAQIRLGDPMDEATEVGPVANRPQFEKVLRYIDVAKADGAHLVLGGKPADRPGLGRGLFIEPTIFKGVANHMRIACEEVFGPILSVIPFKDEADALRIANDSAFGLAAGVWTRDQSRAHRMAAKLHAGTVWVNTYRVTSQLSPFGGFKSSGIGREGGAEALTHYMRTKSVWIDMNDDFASPFKGR